MNPFIEALVRHILTAIGTGLAAKGLVDDTTWQSISGGALALVSVVWSLLDKKKLQTS
jgi:hypothetical protein